MLESFIRDLQYGMRGLRAKPGFTVVAVVALAVGIGANTAIFSVLSSVLLRSLPYDRPEQLVWIWTNNLSSGIRQEPVSFPNFVDWRSQNESFQEMAAFDPWLPTLTGEGEPEKLPCGVVTSGFFHMLGGQPILGRVFSQDEELPGKQYVAILSYGLWQRRFGGNPEVIGRRLMLDGLLHTVVGVMPASFQHPSPESRRNVEIWVPPGYDVKKTPRGLDFLSVIARLKPGVSIKRADAEMKTIADRLAQQYPETNAGWGASVIPLHERFVGDVRQALVILVAAVAFLLLIACANVANLLLVRAAARQKETAVRAAMGASRLRLIRQFLAESLLLALTGGLLGLGLAWGGIRALVAISPGNIPRIEQTHLDWRALAFTLGVSLLMGVFFGIAPALRASRVDLNDSLKEGGKTSAEGASGRRLRSGLAASEVALALVLLIGSGLMLKSFTRLQRVAPGFDTERLLTMELALPRPKYKPGHRIISFTSDLLEKVSALPGVQGAATSFTVPLSGEAPTSTFAVEGRPAEPSGQVDNTQFQVVSPSFFQTMGIPLLRGRRFDSQDRSDSAGVVVINEAMAERFWPGQDPIGKRVTLKDFGSGDWLSVIGVVGSVHYERLNLQPNLQMYLVYTQTPWKDLALLVRTTADPMRTVASVRDKVREVDAELPVYNVRTMNDVVADSLARPRFNTQLISILTAVALTLTVIGVYGVISYSVTQRTQEIGLRMALGAQTPRILGMVIAQGLKLALLGIAIGLLAALLITRLMTSLLYGVSAKDPLIFLATPVLLVGVVLAACYVPARRAAKVDPMIALRYE
jgi:putative ABC transport system permease protein